MFAEAVRSPTNLRLSINVTGSEEARQFNIDSHNALVVQTQLVNKYIKGIFFHRKRYFTVSLIFYRCVLLGQPAR